MQNGHLGKIMINAVDKNDMKPFLREGDFFKTITGFDLQQDVLSDSISTQNMLTTTREYIVSIQLKIRQIRIYSAQN